MVLSFKLATNVQYLRSGGNLKLRLVPNIERNKDNKTLNYTSTPPGANILLVAVVFTLTVVNILAFLFPYMFFHQVEYLQLCPLFLAVQNLQLGLQCHLQTYYFLYTTNLHITAHYIL